MPRTGDGGVEVADSRGGKLSLGGQVGVLADFVWAPSKGFEAVGRYAPLAFPVLAMPPATAAAAWLTIPFSDRAAQRSLALELSAEELAKVAEIQGVVNLLGVAATPLVVVAKWAILAGLVYLAAVLLNGNPRFRRLFSLVAYSSFPLILEGFAVLLVLGLRGLDSVRGPFDLAPPLGLNLLVSEPRSLEYILLNQFNLFQAWHLVLLTLGLAHLSRRRWTRAAVVVVSIWSFQVGAGSAAMFLLAA